jgi:hypothetical protein
MTTLAATVPEREAELRWREWQARGERNDRRSAKMMRIVFLLLATAIVIATAVLA